MSLLILKQLFILLIVLKCVIIKIILWDATENYVINPILFWSKLIILNSFYSVKILI